MPMYFQKKFYKFIGGYQELCDYFANDTLKLIKEQKPDILFLNFLFVCYLFLLSLLKFRWQSSENIPKIKSEAIENDFIVRSIQNFFDEIQPFTKYIFITEPTISFDLNIGTEIGRRLQKKLPLDNMDFTYKVNLFVQKFILIIPLKKLKRNISQKP